MMRSTASLGGTAILERAQAKADAERDDPVVKGRWFREYVRARDLMSWNVEIHAANAHRCAGSGKKRLARWRPAIRSSLRCMISVRAMDAYASTK